MMLASGFMGSSQTAITDNNQVATSSGVTNSVSVASKAIQGNDAALATFKANLNNKNHNLDHKVRIFADDKPLMIEIAYCESRFRQYNNDGSVLRGIENNKDVGLFQINEKYHLERADRLGYDIYSPEGNMAYARLLFNEEGPTPWNSSSPCWSKTAAYTDYKISTGELLAAR